MVEGDIYFRLLPLHEFTGKIIALFSHLSNSQTSAN